MQKVYNKSVCRDQLQSMRIISMIFTFRFLTLFWCSLTHVGDKGQCHHQCLVLSLVIHLNHVMFAAYLH